MYTKPREAGLLGSIVCCGSRGREVVRHRDYCGFGVFPFNSNSQYLLPPNLDPEEADSAIVFAVSESCLAVSSGRSVYVFTVESDQNADTNMRDNNIVVQGPWGEVVSFEPYIEVSDGGSGSKVYVVGRGSASDRFYVCVLGVAVKKQNSVPPELGAVTAISRWNVVSSSTNETRILLGHASGVITAWDRQGVLGFRFRVSAASILAISSDSDFLYVVSSDGFLRLFRFETLEVHSDESLYLVPYLGVHIPDEHYPIRKVIVPWRTAMAGFPGRCILTLTHRNELVRMDLVSGFDAQQDGLVAAGMADAAFGPFDNGPLVSISQTTNSLCAFQQGSYKMYSESEESSLDGVEIVQIKETHSQEDPRLWTLGRRKSDNRVLVLSWRLRDVSSKNN